MKEFYKENQSFFKKIDGLLLGNTVLERGLVIAPVIVAATSLKNSVVLAVAYALITFITVFCTSFIPKRLPYTIRVILYVVFACLVYIPTTWVLTQWLPYGVYNVGVFLPLVVANSLIVRKSETRFFKQKKKAMLFDLICSVVGFMWVICLVGMFREIFGNGTLWDDPVSDWEMPGMLFPFSGFILLGLLSAVFQKLRNHMMGTDQETKEES